MPFLQPYMTRIMSGTNPGFSVDSTTNPGTQINYPGTGADIYQRVSQHVGQTIVAGTFNILAGQSGVSINDPSFNANTVFLVSPRMNTDATPVNNGVLYSVWDGSAFVVFVVDPATGVGINATDYYYFNYVGITPQT